MFHYFWFYSDILQALIHLEDSNSTVYHREWWRYHTNAFCLMLFPTYVWYSFSKQYMKYSSIYQSARNITHVNAVYISLRVTFTLKVLVEKNITKGLRVLFFFAKNKLFSKTCVPICMLLFLWFDKIRTYKINLDITNYI